MTSRPKVDWRVPSDEWDRFLTYVRDEYGEIEGYVGREVERAMREWIDSDEFAGVEEKVDRLVRAAGRTPEVLGEKTPVTTAPGGEGGDTTRVRCRVDSDLKDEFSAYVDRETDDRVGIALARALRARRGGGRSRRVGEKLNRVLDDAADLLEELTSEGDLTLRERRTVAICQRLDDQFTRDELEEEIASVAGDSDPTVRDYTEKVLDRLDHVPHPGNADLFVPEEYARETAPSSGVDLDAPVYERKPYDTLTREEKVHGLRVELSRRAKESTHGKRHLDATTVREEVFTDGRPSGGHARDLMDTAADVDGFETVRKHGKEWLQVDLRDVTDPDLVELGEDDSRDEVSVEDGGSGEDTDSRMDALLNARPVATDGGNDTTGEGEHEK